MGKTSVTQPRAMDLGKPQRRYYVEPDEIPVSQPSRRGSRPGRSTRLPSFAAARDR